MCEWKIERAYPIAEDVKEISVAIDGFSYLVIFGKHINGGFCALPREGISCELSAHDSFGDIGYNAASLSRKLTMRQRMTDSFIVLKRLTFRGCLQRVKLNPYMPPRR